MSTTWINRGHFYCPHVRPILVDCNFIVDHTNGNGLGIRSLKGQGVANVFMNTTATPGAGPNGYVNPNPQPGTILMQFTDNFQRYYGGFSGFISPLSGTNINVTTGVIAGLVYVITSVGTTPTTGSNSWRHLGVPPGVVPAPGVAFVAAGNFTGTGTGTIQVPSATASGIDHIEVEGDPNTTIQPIPMGGSPFVGGFIVLNCYLDTTLTAPSDGTVISLASYLNQSNVVVLGE